MKIRFVSVFAVLSFLLSMPVNVYAADSSSEPPDCSVCVYMHTSDGEAVGGGRLTLYRVGEISAEGEHVVPLGDFSAFDTASLDNVTPELAGQLYAYASEHSLAGVTKEIGEDGTAVFDGLSMGLYLLAEHTPAKGYSEISPFLVMLPSICGGEWVYDINAYPKLAPEQEPETEPSEPSGPSEPQLPFTGQYSAPIPILVTVGVCLAAFGALLCRFEKEDDNS